jgi:hypothetical protein
MKIEAAARLRAYEGYTFTTMLANVEHEQWSALLDRISDPNKIESADIWKKITDLGLFKHVNELFGHVKSMIFKIAAEIGTDIKEIVEVFRTKPMLAFLKAIKFSIVTILKPIKEFAKLYKDGIMKVFEKLHETKALQKLHSGAMKLDDFLDQYPIIKRLAGPAVAGLLVWMWLSGSFTGHPDLDIDLSTAIQAALHGQWSAAELFTSKQGLVALGLLFAGLTLPCPSPPWLASGLPTNALLALCYTAYRHVPKTAELKESFAHIKSKIKFAHL